MPPETGSSWYEGMRRWNARRWNAAQHWRERLDAAMLESSAPSFRPRMKFKGTSAGQLEPEAEPYEQAIAQAMLDQFPHVRLVCVDGGVGAFRVRDLRVVLSNGNQTPSRPSEHGLAYRRPEHGYFSAPQRGRQAAMDLIEAHRRALVVASWCTIRMPLSGRTWVYRSPAR